MIALRGLWLGALRGLWPMVLVEARKLWGLWPMKTQAFDPSPKVRGLWPVVLVDATRPKTHRLDKLFLYKAGVLALPGREWKRKPLALGRPRSARSDKSVRRRFCTGEPARPWPPLLPARHLGSDRTSWRGNGQPLQPKRAKETKCRRLTPQHRQLFRCYKLDGTASLRTAFACKGAAAVPVPFCPPHRNDAVSSAFSSAMSSSSVPEVLLRRGLWPLLTHLACGRCNASLRRGL